MNPTSSEFDEREAPIPIEEERCTDQVELNIVSTYWKAVGIYVSAIVLAMLLYMQSTRNVSDWWLAARITLNNAIRFFTR